MINNREANHGKRREDRKKRREKLLRSGDLSDAEKIILLNGEIQALQAELRDQKVEEFSQTEIKEKIFKISKNTVTPPKWLTKKSKPKSKMIPTIFASDWHYGEVVYGNQVGHVNEYNLEIADERIKNLVNNSLDILFNHLANPKYEGLVFPLGGDMFSGDIHEELAKTNEMPMLPTVLRLAGRLAWAIEVFADHFGRVHVPVVTGNHGRTTRKPAYKNRSWENLDWLLGMLLAVKFKNDHRITFQISDGPDCRYTIYGHRYLLTHGDQFPGGGGIIGAIGPVLQGDSKKRTKESQKGSAYDTLICGHFHQFFSSKKAIINGSLKGYDEYADQHNFSYEEPSQALWLTHPKRGALLPWSVFVDEVSESSKNKKVFPLKWEKKDGTEEFWEPPVTSKKTISKVAKNTFKSKLKRKAKSKAKKRRAKS